MAGSDGYDQNTPFPLVSYYYTYSIRTALQVVYIDSLASEYHLAIFLC